MKMLEVFSYHPQIAYFTYFISNSKIMGGYVRTPRNLQKAKFAIPLLKKYGLGSLNNLAVCKPVLARK